MPDDVSNIVMELVLNLFILISIAFALMFGVRRIKHRRSEQPEESLEEKKKEWAETTPLESGVEPSDEEASTPDWMGEMDDEA